MHECLTDSVLWVHTLTGTHGNQACGQHCTQMQNNAYSYPGTETSTLTPGEVGRDQWFGISPQGENVEQVAFQTLEWMIQLVSKLLSGWRRQMQTIFWQRKSLEHKSQRRWAEINITMLIVFSWMVVLIMACMRQKSQLLRGFSVQLSSPHTLSNCISWCISECRVGYLQASANWHRLTVYLWSRWDWSAYSYTFII